MPELSIKATHKAIKRYYQELEKFEKAGVSHEGAVRSAFQELLIFYGRKLHWTFIPEYIIKRAKSRIQVDGALIDKFRIPHGYWEAKDSRDDLPTEIRKKFSSGYPRDNIIFQAPERAIIYQDGTPISDEDITTSENLIKTLTAFFEYRAPHHEQWEKAVADFKDRIPEYADGVLKLIDKEKKENRKFTEAFNGFMELCRQSINPNLAEDAVKEMLIQHLLTERIFRSVFKNNDFTKRNVVANEIEKVIDALTSRSFSRDEFLRKLDRFYAAIEDAAGGFEDFSEKQKFLNTVYEQFFQGFSVKVADTHGIVYTPQEIVDFMVKSVEHILQKEFGKTLSDKNVHILDPFVGTGNFIVNIIRRIKKTALAHKYKEELHCNEVMLLPYYIASMNIEHEFYEKTGNYEAFPGICLVDTFQLSEPQMEFFNDANTERVVKQKDAPIFVIIGNPPYNAGQVNENDNNKNRKYPVNDGRVAETYKKDSGATLKRKLDDPYVKAIRWATDRIRENGIVALVTNNSFVDEITFDGMRKHLINDFNTIYVMNLRGNIRQDSMRDGIPLGEKHTVFGLAAMVGISITLFTRNQHKVGDRILYGEVDFRATREEKFELLENAGSVAGIKWQEIVPDTNHTWLTGGLQGEYDTFIAIGGKKTKRKGEKDVSSIFKISSPGVSTNRDAVAYDFNENELLREVEQFSQDYNSEIARYQSYGSPKDVDNFVDYKKVKWSASLKDKMRAGKRATFDPTKIRIALYRPFAPRSLYYDSIPIDRPALFKRIFPTSDTEKENRVICVSGIGSSKPFHTLMVTLIPCLDMLEKTQCFPFYTYNKDGSNRRENITDWALKQYREHYGNKKISKWDIFYYIYGILHHPDYRQRYAANLRRELPRVPFAPDFRAFANAGKKLADLHVNYEEAEEYPLEKLENRDEKLDWRVEKMKLSKDKTEIIYNKFLTLRGIPPEAFEYRLGNRSALDWIIDQYRVKTDQRSGIVSDPNNPDDEQYIVRLIAKVITVSLESVKIVNSLPKLGVGD